MLAFLLIYNISKGSFYGGVQNVMRCYFISVVILSPQLVLNLQSYEELMNWEIGSKIMIDGATSTHLKRYLKSCILLRTKFCEGNIIFV